LLTHLGLWERRGEKVVGWSRGMRQKLAVARSLLHRPSLIFLDEPTAGLDPMAAASLRSDLLSLAGREGVTIFLTTHNLAEAEKLCAQVGVIRAGRLLAVGHPDRLRTKAGAHQAVILGRGFSEQALASLRKRPEVAAATLQDSRLVIDLKKEVEIAPLIGLLVNSGAQVEEAHKGKASLEEVFLSLMEEEK
jgi:ABC-2 type transport system ATP-binding protein